MKKYVLWKMFNNYKITDFENYNNSVMDTNKVITIKDCWTLYDAIRTAKQYLYLTDEQIIVK